MTQALAWPAMPSIVFHPDEPLSGQDEEWRVIKPFESRRAGFCMGCDTMVVERA